MTLRERVLITGMGGELGTRVAQLIEQRSWAGEVVGVDFVPPAPPPAPRRVPPHRPARPRPARRVRRRISRRTVVAHFGVYEPASRMSPRSAIERTELCTIATMSAAARAGQAGVRRRAQRARGLRAAHAPRVGARRRRHARAAHPVRPHRCSRSSRSWPGCGCATASPVCALRYAPVVGPHVPSPLGRLLRLPVVPVPRVRRSAVLAAAPRRRGRSDGRRDRPSLRRPAQRRRSGRGDAVAGGAPRRSGTAAGRRPFMWGTRRARRRARGRGDRAACRRALRHGRTGDGRRARSRRSGSTRLVPTQEVLARAVRVGRRGADRDEPGACRMSKLRRHRSERLDADRISPPEPLVLAARAPVRWVAIPSTRSVSIRRSPISSRPCSPR